MTDEERDALIAANSKRIQHIERVMWMLLGAIAMIEGLPTLTALQHLLQTMYNH